MKMAQNSGDFTANGDEISFPKMELDQKKLLW
jgi:hypothetical protein